VCRIEIDLVFGIGLAGLDWMGLEHHGLCLLVLSASFGLRSRKVQQEAE
jgi:hypothetical protein